LCVVTTQGYWVAVPEPLRARRVNRRCALPRLGALGYAGAQLVTEASGRSGCHSVIHARVRVCVESGGAASEAAMSESLSALFEAASLALAAYAMHPTDCALLRLYYTPAGYTPDAATTSALAQRWFKTEASHTVARVPTLEPHNPWALHVVAVRPARA
jgi:hypothetical protein